MIARWPFLPLRLGAAPSQGLKGVWARIQIGACRYLLALVVGLGCPSSFALAREGASIFRLAAPGGSPQILDHDASYKFNPDYVNAELVRRQKTACKLSTNDKCVYFGGTEYGTAFVFVRNDVLITSLHTFAEYLKTYWRISDSNHDIPVPLLLYGDENKIVFGNKNGDTAVLENISDDLKRLILSYPSAEYMSEGTSGLEERPHSDFVLVRLARGVGAPLTAADVEPSIGLSVAARGYTSAFNYHLWRSAGAVISDSCKIVPEAEVATGAADYENDNGLSGAPVFNAAQEVLGIHTANCGKGKPISLPKPSLWIDAR